jgi:hypothetical protein
MVGQAAGQMDVVDMKNLNILKGQAFNKGIM